MSFDWTKEELLRELKEREEAGEPKEVTFDFVWSVVERAYKERDQFVGAADTERAAVVAWLRVAWGAVNLVSTDIVSAEIERGEHRRGEQE